MSDRDILTDPQWQAFQRQLDAQPDSHDTRAVLADWLEGQGHPWAKAYRWMARMEKWPVIDDDSADVFPGWYTSAIVGEPIPNHAILPWVGLISDRKTHEIIDAFDRHDAEVRLCELFDQLPLEGKEEYADA